MKKMIVALLLSCVCLTAVACYDGSLNTTDGTEPSTCPTVPTTTQPTPSTAPALQGWIDEDGKRYYYVDGVMLLGWQQIEDTLYYLGEDGALCTGWQQIEDALYYLGEDGALCTGWLQIEDSRYYLGEDGIVRTGWQEVEGLNRYFQADGALATGWQQIEGNNYYLDSEGCAVTGWADVEDKRYYLGEDGAMVTGWLELEGALYYLKENGAMARGCVEIDGVKNYFTSTGAYIVLANPWNYIPEGYDPDLVTLNKYANYSNMYISRICYDALMQMLSDCQKQASYAVVVSSYRTHDFQTKNFERKVQYYIGLGYGRAEAEVLAAKVVAVPGTSEHQLGLAVDIIDINWPYLDNTQATMPAQKWLMAHSWEYGFILRYPAGKTDVTGIIYEPWHYRYVGTELAAELHASGLTLEEYLDQLTEQ